MEGARPPTDLQHPDPQQRSAFMTEPEIRKGLAGVVVDTTSISKVNPDTNSLLYRGYPVQELAASCSFEQVAHLLWHGELPNAAQLAEFERAERSQRSLDETVRLVIDQLPVKVADDGTVCVADEAIGTLTGPLHGDEDEAQDVERSGVRIGLPAEHHFQKMAGIM